jgi:hypothetical protein
VGGKGFEEILLDPDAVPTARVSPRATTWTCRGCGAVLPVSVPTCLHAIEVPRPPPRPQPRVRAASPASHALTVGDVAGAFRDAADLVATHRMSLPEALRAVADRIDAAKR